MLTAVTRNTIFQASVFVDNYIAEMQQSYASNFDKNNKQDAAILKQYYDHLIPFKTTDSSSNKFGVLAYAANDKKDYQTNLSLQIQELLLSLNISELWLMQFLKTNIASDFPFENFTKKNIFKQLGSVKSNNIGYRFATNQLSKILPLFFFSKQYDIPVILLFAVNHSLALRLCDDGNFHFEVSENIFQQFSNNAISKNLIVADDNICSRCSVFYFNKSNQNGNLLINSCQ